MLALHAAQRFYLYRHATDLRKGFNGLTGLVRQQLGRDPLDGSAYLFINRRRDRMKILVWETGGFVLYYKLLESGTFELPAFANHSHATLRWSELVRMVEGVKRASVQHRRRYHPTQLTP